MSRFRSGKPSPKVAVVERGLIIGMIVGVILDLITKCLGTGLPVCTLICVLAGLVIAYSIRSKMK